MLLDAVIEASPTFTEYTRVSELRWLRNTSNEVLDEFATRQFDAKKRSNSVDVCSSLCNASSLVSPHVMAAVSSA